jgi:tyrosinase
MVHDSVGGWMGNVPSAAGDPLFYVHLCQIDRLYAIWEEKSGVSYNWGTDATQPDQNTWKTQPSSFVDENGTLVQVKLGDAVNTQTLQYGYDTLATPPPAQIASLRVAPLTAPANRVIRAAMRSNNFTVKSGGASLWRRN